MRLLEDDGGCRSFIQQIRNIHAGSIRIKYIPTACALCTVLTGWLVEHALLPRVALRERLVARREAPDLDVHARKLW